MIDHLKADGWLTPNTYCNYFSPLPTKSGVYIYIGYDKNDPRRPKALYIGLSKNIYARHQNHKIKRHLKNYLVQIWFKEFPMEILHAKEAEYIRSFKPALNIIGIERCA